MHNTNIEPTRNTKRTKKKKWPETPHTLGEVKPGDYVNIRVQVTRNEGDETTWIRINEKGPIPVSQTVEVS